MPRSKSEDKRNAILSAATQVFAERGLGAPTSAISQAAGVAEGTLFTYFPTKDELINALYREIKLELADAMMSNFPRRAAIRNRFQHVWDRYVIWGVNNPEQQKVLQQMTGLGRAHRRVQARRNHALPRNRENCGSGRSPAPLSRPARSTSFAPP